MIWNCRQGRERVLKTLSRQLRMGNALSNAFSVSLTAPAEANGPKYSVSGALGTAMLADQRELVAVRRKM